MIGWESYGTALKPAWEPAILARKPLEGTVAANVAKWGCGALAIDACRIDWQSEADKAAGRPASYPRAHEGFEGKSFAIADRSHRDSVAEQATGRWPANVAMDEDAAAALDAQTGNRPGMSSGGSGRRDASMFGVGGITKPETVRGDSGGASRFFYCAKVSTREREHGCASLPQRTTGEATSGGMRNHHPTLKPIALTQWLARLILPPTSDARLLVPFAGAGSEMIGAMRAGWTRITGIEREAEYVAIANCRLRVG